MVWGSFTFGSLRFRMTKDSLYATKEKGKEEFIFF
jgi:hypothetical protein